MASKDGHWLPENSVPEGWKRARLEDVAEINPKRPRLNVDDEVPTTFIPMAAVAEDCVGIAVREIRPYREVSRGYTYFEENDVLLAKITPCLQNGKHALATSLEGGFGFGTTEFHVIRAGLKIDPRHLFRILTSPANIERCERSFNGTAGQQRVHPDTVRGIPLLLPPLPEQRAIAAVLDSIDEAIERTEAVIAATEQLRDSLLHELLTRGVPGWHTEWKDVPGLGTIPADWDVVRLGDVLKSTTYGTNASMDGSGSVRVLRMSNIQDGEIKMSDVQWASITDKELTDLDLAPGDILFNRTNSLGLVGKVAIVRELPQPISFASYLVRLRVYQALANPYWLGALLWSQDWQSRIRRFATPAVSQANINPTSLKTLAIPLPLLPEQQAITEVLDGIDIAIGRAHEERERMQAFKGSAANALLTGRVRILEDRAVENG